MKKLLSVCMACIYFNGNAQVLNESLATRLARMPLHCIRQEFPNKTSHTADSSTDAVLLPSQLHPAFYGCLDWHSSVHGHWLLVRVLKMYPGIAIQDSIIDALNNSFQEQKIQEEVAYFTRYKNTKSFERTYGWAWWLKLDQELFSWDHPNAKKWHAAIQPLTRHIVQLWKAYLPKQTYPNRTGVHSNSAFALAFALDWARELKDSSFEHAVIKKASHFYLNNTVTPAYLEPDGADFFSPSLQIADLMRRILPAKKFIPWLNAFYEQRSIKRITEMPVVSDRTDYQIVHLDGLAISRAWCMKGIAKHLPATHPWKKLFEQTSGRFLAQTMPNVTSGNYGGDHWLASFLLYALL